jgi:hypothetical protein
MKLIFEWPGWYERQGFKNLSKGKIDKTQWQQWFRHILNKILKDVIEG